MELKILYWIQNLHSADLNSIMVCIFNIIVGSKGEIWVILGIVLFLIPKTRKTGLYILASYIIAYYIGDGILKNLIARPRPCMVNPEIELIVSRPSSFSCPSVHSMLAFASASAIFWNYRKSGTFALVFAALIGFSRMYFFVHYPSDVLLGAVLGFGIGSVVYCLGRSTNN